MDGPRFDELTKTLVAATPSRREALRRLAGGALATVFGGLALEEASAQDVGIALRTCGQPCTRNSDCNAGLRCAARSKECLAIPSSRTRCTGNGECPRNYETCNPNNDRCVNTLAGDCPECLRRRDCAAGEECRDGRCR